MSDYIIETHNLTKKYGEQESVSNLNIHVKEGRIYGLLGRNGAGKTTTMKMLLGLTAPTSGEVKIFGKPIQGNEKKILPRVGCLNREPIQQRTLKGSEITIYKCSCNADQTAAKKQVRHTSAAQKSCDASGSKPKTSQLLHLSAVLHTFIFSKTGIPSQYDTVFGGQRQRRETAAYSACPDRTAFPAQGRSGGRMFFLPSPRPAR